MLQLSLLGPFSASLDNQPLENFRTNKVQALLIYLAVERARPHRREALMALLWPDLPLESAQVNLRQTIYRLRQATGDRPTPLLLTDRQSVSLHPQADLCLDVDEFHAALTRDPAQAVGLYRGDFLADFYLADSNAFEQWAETRREKLRQQALAALDSLTAAAIGRADFERAQELAWRQLEIDNLRESAYRQLMHALAGKGQRAAALAQFQLCRQRLAEELGIEPGQETLALYEQIQADALRQTRQPTQKRGAGMPVFLLTDIEGSTRLWDTHRQAMLPALLRHNAILEEHIDRHGGRILELRGDGVKAVFEGANPLACLIAIQKALGAANWGEIGDLRIRMGLHGVPPVRKGYDYFEENDKYYGPVLNHTARIMDAGWGGQILVSAQVHDHFGLPAGGGWRDHGLHALKSLDQPVHIYELIHPDLPRQSFPPLRTLSTQSAAQAEKSPAPRHNLEAQATPFIGRARELATLDELLAAPKNRLISIVGPGGMGKTRLAISCAERQIAAGRFADGVFFVPLAPLAAPAQIAPLIAKTLNIPLEPGQSTEGLERSGQGETSQAAKLLNYLQNKQMLLVLDNFEHLVEGAAIITEISRAAPAVTILTTSRERLHISGEQVFPIQGLDFPDWEAPEDPCDYTAMELFLASAHRVRPGFELVAGEMVYLARICKLVGGMPLGLELAAAWVDMLSMEAIVAEIQGNLDFLETDLRDVPDRHRSIRAIFDTSWARLSAAEQQIFPRFALLRGGFRREAAEKVAGATLKTLAALVSKSLLQYSQETNSYQIHELLRQYGLERLQANSAEERQSRDQHSAYFCTLIQQHMQALVSGQSPAAIDEIEADIANIQAAWDWAIAQGDLARVEQAFDGLCIYYDWNWRGREGLAISESVCRMLGKAAHLGLARPTESAESQLSQRIYVKALCWQGYFHFYFDHARAPELLEQSLSLANQLLEAGVDARVEKVLILFFRGIGLFHQGNFEAARACIQDNLALSQEIRQQWMVLKNMGLLGDIALNAGSPRAAQSWYEKCLIEARLQGNRGGELTALHDLGWAARRQMAYTEARRFFLESLELSERYQSPFDQLRAIESLGYLALFSGQLDEAIDQFERAIAIAKDAGMPQRAISCQVHIGFSHWLAGNLEPAEGYFREAITIAEKSGSLSPIFPITCYAEYFAMQGRYREATRQIQLAQAITGEILIDRFIQGRIDRVSGWIALAGRDYAGAQKLFQHSIDLYRQNADDEQVAWSQAGLARALIGLGATREAREVLAEALWTAIEIQGFIPLVFSLPVAILHLEREASELARRLYPELQKSPFLARARLITDIAWKYLPEEFKAPSGAAAGGASELVPSLWAAASHVLSRWTQEWMEESFAIELSPPQANPPRP